jgi:hypothetical protein
MRFRGQAALISILWRELNEGLTMKITPEEIDSTKNIADFFNRLSQEDFVLHGSPHRFDIAEPRQARAAVAKRHQNLNAIYGSIATEFALIHAMISDEHGESCYRIDAEQGLIVVKGGHLVVSPGYVYVLPTATFEPLDDGVGGMWRVAYQPVVPTARVEVDATLLPHFPLIAFECETLSRAARPL